jgi:hypothetical protein
MSEVNNRSAWETATGILLAAFAVLIVFTFRSYGVTVDERHSNLNGRYFIDWYASGFHDRAIIDEGNQRLYGSFFNSISAFISDNSPLGLYETGHLVIAITSLIGVFFAYRLGKRLAGPIAGFFSALLLILTPVYYGHSFINPKDIPFAVLFLISVYYLTVSYDHLPLLGAKRVIILGAAIGLTLGIRVGAVMLFGYLLVLIALWLVARYRQNSSYRGRVVWNDLRSAAFSCIAVGAVAWIVMLIWWPYGQVSPILNPLRALKRNADFTDFSANSLYQGRFIPSDALPRGYLPTWFSITLPEFYALILSIGVIALLVRRLVRKPTSEPVDADRQSKILFLIFATGFPVATAIVMHPILYDGNRHFLFVVPPLAVLTGVTLAWLLTKGLSRPLKLATAGVALVLGGMTAIDMIRLHPYEYVFFNRSFGGLKSALGHYETDYWGVSHKEGIDWLIDNYKPKAPKGSIRVANTAADFQTSYYLRPDRAETARFTPVGKRENPDVMLSITRYDVHLKYPGKVLHVVERMGTPLLYVTELNSDAGRPR